MSKKNKRKLIIILIVCLIIMIGLIFFLNKILKTKKYEESIKEFQEFRENYESQTILPRKIYELYNYEGDYDRDFLYKHMKKFVDYMGYLKTNINRDNCAEYYDLYSEEILSVLGINSNEQFEKFVQNIENKNVKLEDFKYAEIKAGSSYEEKGYFKFVLYLYYGDNNELVEFNVSFAKSQTNKFPVIYEFI